MESVLSCTRSDLYINSHTSLENIHINQIQDLVSQRVRGIPLPYVLGYSYFYQSKFSVSPDVLIPRPETEIVIDIIREFENREHCFFIDMGTGSGIIAHTLVTLNKTWNAIALDISLPALKIAQNNCSKKVILCASDKFFSLKKKSIFDFIVSNPPYITTDEMEKIDGSVRMFEPSIALWGGIDGLSFYKYLAKQSSVFLKNKGRIYCEIGASQGEGVKKIFSDEGWQEIQIFCDLTQRHRVLRAQWI